MGLRCEWWILIGNNHSQSNCGSANGNSMLRWWDFWMVWYFGLLIINTSQSINHHQPSNQAIEGLFWLLFLISVEPKTTRPQCPICLLRQRWQGLFACPRIRWWLMVCSQTYHKARCCEGFENPCQRQYDKGHHTTLRWGHFLMSSSSTLMERSKSRRTSPLQSPKTSKLSKLVCATQTL